MRSRWKKLRRSAKRNKKKSNRQIGEKDEWIKELEIVMKKKEQQIQPKVQRVVHFEFEWLKQERERGERITINDMLNTSSANYNLSLMRVEILINYGKLMLDSNLNEIQLMMEWSGKLHL